MQPADIIPIDPDEFFAAHEYAAMVAENEFLDEIPALKQNMKFGGQMLRFANVPANRFGFAVMEFFRGRRHDKGWSFMMRFFAMMGVMKQIGYEKEMLPFVRKEADGRLEFHRAIFDVAATQKLNAQFEFSPATFLRSVKLAAKRLSSTGTRHVRT